MHNAESYRAYIKNNPKGYWFKRKAYGWGWVPATWQGRVATLLYIAILLIGGLILDEGVQSVKATGTFVVFVILTTLLFTTLAYKTGQKPRWQWGIPKEK